MSESTINLPDGHDPVMHHALIWMENSRISGMNFLNMMTSIRDDIVHMNLTDKEKDMFELGVYVCRFMMENYGGQEGK